MSVSAPSITQTIRQYGIVRLGYINISISAIYCSYNIHYQCGEFKFTSTGNRFTAACTRIVIKSLYYEFIVCFSCQIAILLAITSSSLIRGALLLHYKILSTSCAHAIIAVQRNLLKIH